MPTVLVVEDESPIRDMVKEILEDEGYIVVGMINGRQALNTLEILIPDVILTDITMPEMDGIEFCNAVQALPHLASIPIIVMSAATNRLLATQCRCAGFLEKPFLITTLVSIVAAVLSPRVDSISQGEGLFF